MSQPTRNAVRALRNNAIVVYCDASVAFRAAHDAHNATAFDADAAIRATFFSDAAVGLLNSANDAYTAAINLLRAANDAYATAFVDKED